MNGVRKSLLALLTQLSGVLLAMIVTVVLTSCSPTVNFKQNEVRPEEKIGVFAVRFQTSAVNDKLASVTTQASVNNSEAIRQKLAENPSEIMVMKAFMNAFPSRTHANVIPVLKTQVVPGKDRANFPDLVMTGKNIGLDYFVLLTVRQGLLTTGYQFKEQWKPILTVEAKMIRVTDEKIMFSRKVDVEAKPFDKYLDPMSSGKGLEKLFANLSRSAVIDLMSAVGPVVREVPQHEKITHQKLQSYTHIRAMARKNNCAINGELRVVKAIDKVVYHVPCRDITLTYACESESENSHCWLQ